MIVDVIIPVFNEDESIGLVIDDIPKHLVREIIVVNNGSTDRSVQVAHAHGATVLDQQKKGYGNACLKGMEHISKKPLIEKPDSVVFLDGDYSDYPQEMGMLLDKIKVQNCDLVIGSRDLGEREKGSMMPQQIFGNWLATTLIRWLYKVRFTDLGPFRAVKYDKLLELEMCDKTFGWTVEMQVKAAKKGFICGEVPVSYRRRIGVSKVTGTIKGSIMAGYKIIYTIFKYK